MSNPTDTNQASKDGIRDLLRIIDIESGDEPDSYWIDESSIEKATAAIQELIRTEKLKLLAEVRERVVGEDKPLQGKYRASGLMSYDMTNHYENSLRAEQRAALNKLEAEL